MRKIHMIILRYASRVRKVKLFAHSYFETGILLQLLYFGYLFRLDFNIGCLFCRFILTVSAFTTFCTLKYMMEKINFVRSECGDEEDCRKHSSKRNAPFFLRPHTHRIF